jgi:hypothetical protein
MITSWGLLSQGIAEVLLNFFVSPFLPSWYEDSPSGIGAFMLQKKVRGLFYGWLQERKVRGR